MHPVEPNAFIPRRRSGDNILIAQECVEKMLSNKSRQRNIHLIHPLATTTLAQCRQDSGHPLATGPPPSHASHGQLLTRSHHQGQYHLNGQQLSCFTCCFSLSPLLFMLFFGARKLPSTSQTTQTTSSRRGRDFETILAYNRHQNHCRRLLPRQCFPLFTLIFQPTGGWTPLVTTSNTLPLLSPFDLEQRLPLPCFHLHFSTMSTIGPFGACLSYRVHMPMPIYATRPSQFQPNSITRIELIRPS